MNDILGRLENRLGKSKKVGNEYVFRTCPDCGNDKANLQVCFTQGVTHCWACGRGYKLKMFLNRLGILVKEGVIEAMQEEGSDVFVETLDLGKWLPLWLHTVNVEERPWWKYFQDRGLTVEDLTAWGCRVNDLANQVILPVVEGKDLVFWYRRDFDMGKWLLPKGIRRSEVVVTKFWDRRDRRIVLVEGPSDAMKVWKAGFNVMLLGGKRLFPKGAEFIKRAQLQPIALLDSDVRGEEIGYLEQFLDNVLVAEVVPYKDPGEAPLDKIVEAVNRSCKRTLSFNLRRRWRK